MIGIPERYKDIKGFLDWVNFDDSALLKEALEKEERLIEEEAKLGEKMQNLANDAYFIGESEVLAVADIREKWEQVHAELLKARSVPLDLGSKYRAWVRGILHEIALVNRKRTEGVITQEDAQKLRVEILKRCGGASRNLQYIPSFDQTNVIGTDGVLSPTKTSTGGREYLYLLYLLGNEKRAANVSECEICHKIVISYHRARPAIVCRSKDGKRSECYRKWDNKRKLEERKSSRKS